MMRKLPHGLWAHKSTEKWNENYFDISLSHKAIRRVELSVEYLCLFENWCNLTPCSYLSKESDDTTESYEHGESLREGGQSGNDALAEETNEENAAPAIDIGQGSEYDGSQQHPGHVKALYEIDEELPFADEMPLKWKDICARSNFL